jgi:sulfotransferase family protein
MSNEIKLADVGEEQSLRVFMRRLKRHPAFRTWKMPFDLVRDSMTGSWRLATNGLRHLPTTVIVGAQKAGTTQLYAYMVKHPRCYGAAEKEVDYFSKHPKRRVAWYRSRFPWRRRVLRRQGHVIEASPSYLPTPSAIRKMHTVLPNARVIAIVRDPVSRAFSHYQHKKTRHLESRSFAEAVEEEIRTNAFPAQWGVALREGAQPMLGYVARGYYALQLELLQKVYRRNRILVLDSANLFADTAATCNRVFDYMGLEDFDVEPGKVYNRGFYKEKIDPRVAERLREHYRPYDEMLQELLEQSFGWMTPRLAMVAQAA